jgi:hypothetical protein
MLLHTYFLMAIPVPPCDLELGTPWVGEEGKMSIRVSRTRILLTAGVVGMAIGLALWGRHGSVSPAAAQQPVAASDSVPTVAKEGSDYSKRVIAYIYDTIPITREEFGEYLIARCGVGDRINNMVNRCIIEHEAKARGVVVTAAEVDAEFNESLRGINTNQKDFVSTILRPYNKTLYEWKEDVIKPRMLLVKMCRQRVVATEEALKNAYEAYYGEKMHCRTIMWPRSEQMIAVAAYPRVRDSEKEFDEFARRQYNRELAAKAGDMPPFGHNTTGNLDMEKAAFRLNPGEITPLIETPEGFVVLKCVERIPPSHTKTFDEARAELTEEVIKRELDQHEIPRFFKELRDKAHPKIFLKEASQPEDIMSEVRHDLNTPVGGSN